tara:strand:+ start:402 stop:623 length:222 start_codon:yes stop_codon:yes gene_type:complete
MHSSVNDWCPDRYFVTIKDVTNFLGVSRSTITRKEQKNQFPRRQKILGRRVGYKKEHILQFVEGNWSPKGGQK